ncbi:MAG: hypothetical protein R2746_09405 [Acidimicrobiales bacterium]
MTQPRLRLVPAILVALVALLVVAPLWGVPSAAQAQSSASDRPGRVLVVTILALPGSRWPTATSRTCRPSSSRAP